NLMSSLLRPRSRLRSCIVTALRSHAQLAVAVRFGVNFYLAIPTLIFRRSRFISNRVLRANVVGYGAADGVNFVQRLRKESQSSRPFRHDLQRPFRMFRMLFFLQNPEGVHGRSALHLQPPYRLL